MQAMKSLFVCSFLFSFLSVSTTTTPDTITPSRSMRDGETLVSAGGSFQLGFFRPGTSKGRYLGIWYSVHTETVVWVANRERPLGDSSGVLKVTEQGVLVLLNSTNTIVWSSNSSTTAGNPVSQLMDSGNLVLKDGNETNPDKFLWQSFDYPCDTFLPEMKLGWDLVTGLERYLSSWRSTDDPAPGEFSSRMDRHGFPQVVTMKGAKIMSRPGSWNGLHFTGYPYHPQTQSNPALEYEIVLNKDEAYYEYRLLNTSMFSRYVLNPSGTAQQFTWVYQTHRWELSSAVQADKCQNYALCGAYTTCRVNVSPKCACLKGFVPKSPKDWNSGYWSDGCVRKIPLACSSGDGFLNYTGVKLPDTSSSWYNKSMSLKECNGLCLNNCSCTAYANLDIREGGTGCLLWFGNLTDMTQFTSGGGGGQDLYVRMAASELDHIEEKSKFNKKKLPGILISSAVFLVVTLLIGLILYIRNKKLRNHG
ncbi:PREDICTED: G-type lectin S-receptor-like serine/threonine-protein kinase At4g27290 [Prunus mume]|uniref:G-type lectin S-receptor-like serine/threonine-protein kinase At4g27290 n=1 Tax=Prunus mume TaxID=102107 RepID=A0ABM1LLE5_PRUMU|nr:PREDICTED: G-type lectin S-receptor-like serine/threonine-protein kinase At4g27290 [Prunus mume]